MSLADLLPAVRSLPRRDQVQLMHYLVEELGCRPVSEGPDAGAPVLTAPLAYEIFSPEPCPEAADALLKLLAADRDSNA